jgi:hypothetical protein
MQCLQTAHARLLWADGARTKGCCALLCGCDMFIAIGASHGALAFVDGGNVEYIRAPFDQLFACQQWSQSALCMR